MGVPAANHHHTIRISPNGASCFSLGQRPRNWSRLLPKPCKSEIEIARAMPPLQGLSGLASVRLGRCPRLERLRRFAAEDNLATQALPFHSAEVLLCATRNRLHVTAGAPWGQTVRNANNNVSRIVSYFEFGASCPRGFRLFRLDGGQKR